MTSESNKSISLSPMELMLFFETMGLLLSSGITVEESLKIMKRDADKGKESGAIADLLKILPHTYELSVAMEKVERFPNYAVNMVRVSERSGNLEKGCASLAGFYKEEHQQGTQIRSAISNPFILVCIMAVVVAFLVNAILPIFSNIYRQIGANMESNNMVKAALAIGSGAMWVIFSVLILVILAFFYGKTKSGRNFFSNLAERSFFTRKFHMSRSMARFTSTFAMLLDSGDDLPIALALAGTVCRNQSIRERIDRCHKQVLSGNSLSDVLIESGLFNPTHVGMIKSGVRSGATPKVMKKLSDLYEEDAERILFGFVTLIEPLLISVLSVIIGVVLLCIMLPLIGILSSVG
ncbi:MAG: type II secretion system F family protein [Peptococcaceae bacterium]|nr:type II secretion system F family protein [Peptococcaceae bacterium]